MERKFKLTQTFKEKIHNACCPHAVESHSKKLGFACRISAIILVSSIVFLKCSWVAGEHWEIYSKNKEKKGKKEKYIPSLVKHVHKKLEIRQLQYRNNKRRISSANV